MTVAVKVREFNFKSLYLEIKKWVKWVKKVKPRYWPGLLLNWPSAKFSQM